MKKIQLCFYEQTKSERIVKINGKVTYYNIKTTADRNGKNIYTLYYGVDPIKSFKKLSECRKYIEEI